MPITSSAKKAIRQSLRKREFNLKRINEMKIAVKSAKKAGAEKSNEATKFISAAYKAIDKAAKRGIIKKGAADRKKSRLAKFLAKSK